ncbi:hypothetical protein EDD16DRAFT_1520233 [Pisolithus croceorrhizus]|nr:hypothetical protein EDD16DRAFT_1520233 [Pisolithus croceorrhizus]
MSINEDVNRKAPLFSASLATALMATVDHSSDHQSMPDYTAPPNALFPLSYVLWLCCFFASSSAMADQIAATSQALMLIHSTAFGGLEESNDVVNVKAHMDGIEVHFGTVPSVVESLLRPFSTFEALKMRMASGQTGVEEAGTRAILGREAGGNERTNAVLAEKMEKKLNEWVEIINLDQKRLLACLHDLHATSMKALIVLPPTSSEQWQATARISYNMRRVRTHYE